MYRHVTRILLFLLFLSGGVLTAFAQSAQFSGSVTDQHQARAQNAQIRVMNQNTGVWREANTNAEGAYVVSFVPSGTYKIFVKAQGFSTAVSEPLTVTVGQEMVFDVQTEGRQRDAGSDRAMVDRKSSIPLTPASALSSTGSLLTTFP